MKGFESEMSAPYSSETERLNRASGSKGTRFN